MGAEDRKIEKSILVIKNQIKGLEERKKTQKEIANNKKKRVKV